MVIKEIIRIEDNNNIYLHKEGLFWRAYEYSAFAFVENIKGYNAKKKFVKKLNNDIVFIGFPDSALYNILEFCKQKGFAVNKNNSLIKIELATKKEGFSKWKDEIETVPSKKEKNTDTAISERVANFPLATKTPIEAQQFLYTLQMELNGNL